MDPSQSPSTNKEKTPCILLFNVLFNDEKKYITNILRFLIK